MYTEIAFPVVALVIGVIIGRLSKSRSPSFNAEKYLLERIQSLASAAETTQGLDARIQKLMDAYRTLFETKN
jgi:small basic protein